MPLLLGLTDLSLENLKFTGIVNFITKLTKFVWFDGHMVPVAQSYGSQMPVELEGVRCLVEDDDQHQSCSSSHQQYTKSTLSIN